MFDRLKELEKRYKELEVLLADPKILKDKSQYQRYAKEIAGITEIVNNYRRYNELAEEIKELKELLNAKDLDAEFLQMTRHEIESLTEKQGKVKSDLELLLAPKDEEADKDVIVEIRAGTGGLEASLFAADLYRMYTKYAMKMGWNIEIMSSHPTELGGIKEIVFSLKGKDVYRRLKFESGVHRVQRVPTTEASGRIHTSAATVAIMVEPQDVELKIDPQDLKVDVFRSSGHGGQSVNTTDSAVRITHIPSGLVVTCQDERSQLKNKNKALRVLRARLLQQIRDEEAKKISQERRSQVGSGDRSEKIRTYNFPDRRVTDHRIGLTLHKLDSILDGNLDEITDSLIEELNKKQ
jgi:peptide chain release factor 1